MGVKDEENLYLQTLKEDAVTFENEGRDSSLGNPYSNNIIQDKNGKSLFQVRKKSEAALLQDRIQRLQKSNPLTLKNSQSPHHLAISNIINKEEGDEDDRGEKPHKHHHRNRSPHFQNLVMAS